MGYSPLGIGPGMFAGSSEKGNFGLSPAYGGTGGKGIGVLGNLIKYGGPASMVAGIGFDVADKLGLFGDSPQEKRQKWIESLIAKAGAEFERGLASRAGRFARARTLSGVDRQAQALRSGGSGRATRTRTRLTTGLGAAGRGISESVGGAIESGANFDAANFMSGILSQINQQSEAGALQEATGRADIVKAGIFSQPLQENRAQYPRDLDLQEPLGNAMDYLGAYYNAREKAKGKSNERLFF